MARVRLVNVTKRFGSTVAVDRVTADIAEGEFVTLLGPSGCGKTTTLRMVAGLTDPTEGAILFDDRVMNDVPAYRRHIGLAFQSHALFPHLTVAKNIAFGLEVQRRSKSEIRQRVGEMLELIDLSGYGDRMPTQLSGGQQQRVALARMLATDPTVLLFDEPLSALDRNLRDTLKYSILALQRRTKKTAIYVTHDQSEAFAISDRIFVMNKGQIEQSGSQLDIYLRPASEFVAHFVGDNNAIRGTVARTIDNSDGRRNVLVSTEHGFEISTAAQRDWEVGQTILAFVRPENVEVLDDTDRGDESGIVEGKVEHVVFEGPNVVVTLDVNGLELKVSVSGAERLTLLGKSQQTLRVRLHEISLVPAALAAVA